MGASEPSGLERVPIKRAHEGRRQQRRWASGCYFGKAQRRTQFESLEKEQEGLEEALHPKPKEAAKEAPRFDVEKLNEENRRLAPRPGQTPVYGI